MQTRLFCAVVNKDQPLRRPCGEPRGL